MSLIDENYKGDGSSRKVFFAFGIGIILVVVIIVILLLLLGTLNSNKSGLTVDGKGYSISKNIIKKDDVLYIGIEDLTNMLNKENANFAYNYKSGGKDIEDENQCYITNKYESTFFMVNSKDIYKVAASTNQTEYYTLDNPIIKENEKIYMPISAVKVAMNANYRNNNNKITINSIGYLEKNFNQAASATFKPDSSIIWETTYSNKKLLKYGLVIIKDNESKLGIATVSASTTKDNKNKTATTVTTNSVITPKYKDIKYVEKYNQLVVESQEGKKGIIQLYEEDGNLKVDSTLILPQYDDIMPIGHDLYIISKITSDGTKENERKYGIINKEEDEILPTEYDGIGIDATKFTNNDLNNPYIIYDNLIPVKKGNLYGFSNLNGKIVINTKYTGLGYAESNPNNNVLIIPSLEAIVVNDNGYYSIIKRTGTTLINGDGKNQNNISKVYREEEDGKLQYKIVYNDTKYEINYFLEHKSEIEKKSSDTSKNTKTN